MSTSLAPVAMPYGDMTEASLNGMLWIVSMKVLPPSQPYPC